mgnify:CR=1 FL=1
MKPSTDPGAEILRATLFAARAHAGQTRKGAAAEPYVNHVIEVAEILAAHGAPLPVVLAGLLHDTVEDTEVTHADLVATFGAEVAGLVAEAGVAPSTAAAPAAPAASPAPVRNFRRVDACASDR